MLGLISMLLACGGAPRSVTVYQNERFEPSETFSRLFDASVEATCEAARRALLGQGYLLTAVRPDSLSATKNFQPEGDVHVQIVFNVVCAPEPSPAGSVTTAYVSAVQDRYVLKKSPNSASVGVAALGSLSIPLTASDDSLVRVASETIPAGQFYDRFFALMLRNLVAHPGDE
ncbi:DUF2242 domain-containing protein [Accumulibacter sp.]|uniref:DUF2242 domain-containing protein n=1 Tax=Accumulibacter sp. TaxID=2053492 RepID=UPI0025CCD76A|nr:DUF2242 domain-containing protein [Accumulibacter sp.]MCM8593933.1 DUF2242 domain-containing protein [Accumulibacter sp.]MCM8627782.1 DUF2242 domain-containing protein [Accumulibacter sp.]MDS4048074.1 DUF2242 domain-containing protein [Accumulibacter sp.]